MSVGSGQNSPEPDEGEPWSTARLIIAEMGFGAEPWVIRRVVQFEADGDIEDAIKLAQVLDAIRALRAQAGIAGSSHLRRARRGTQARP